MHAGPEMRFARVPVESCSADSNGLAVASALSPVAQPVPIRSPHGPACPASRRWHQRHAAIVTSTPPPPGYLLTDLGITVATGDLAIHTLDGDYWYGVDVNLADRGANLYEDPPLSQDIGQGLYHTEGTGWYTTNLRRR